MSCTLSYGQGHDAIPLLKGYDMDGCLVEYGPTWTKEHFLLTHIDQQQGKRICQLCQETTEKIKH
eukprot:8994397-Ditylum_brightwellii.AAC.1